MAGGRSGPLAPRSARAQLTLASSAFALFLASAAVGPAVPAQGLSATSQGTVRAPRSGLPSGLSQITLPGGSNGSGRSSGPSGAGRNTPTGEAPPGPVGPPSAGTGPPGAGGVAEPVVSPVTSNPTGPSCPAKPYTQSSPGLDPNGPQGMDTEDACSRFTRGDPRVVVAYIEGGVNWHLPGIGPVSAGGNGLADQIYVNWKELPIPCVGDSSATAVMPTLGGIACAPAWSTDPKYYAIPTADGSDAQRAPDGQYVVDASDWSHDPRVQDSNANGFVDPEDLIVAFSCFDPALITDDVSHVAAVVAGSPGDASKAIGQATRPGGRLSCTNGAQSVSSDGSGFPHDISGWNFYNGDNDPATPDATYPHSDGEMNQVDSYCPYCMIMPVKAGAEALDQTDELAEAWLFAGETGASVITSVTADLGYSTFMRDVVSYLESKGVVMVEASNDFDSTDHQGGMFWPNVIPGNSVEVDVAGTRWTRSDTTSWGTHNMFDVAGAGTTSTSTADMGGLFGLLLSSGDEQLAGGYPTPLFGGPEAVQVMRETATAIHDTRQRWPGAPGDWSEQYGYGIVDLYKAMRAIAIGDLPPVAQLTSPNWYTIEDPASRSSFHVSGEVSAPPGQRYTWSLQYGLGPQPTDWQSIVEGAGIGRGAQSPTTVGGDVALDRIPQRFWAAAFKLSQNQTLPTADQYDVTLRILVKDGLGRVGSDRRTVDVVHDPTWLRGFPAALTSSGESAPALADLTGSGRLDVIFGTADGRIDVVDPKTGKPPVGTDWSDAHTMSTTTAGWPAAAPWPIPVARNDVFDAIISDVAVGSLDGTGRPSVVAATESGYVYVYDSHGDLAPGWPRLLATAAPEPAVPRPSLPYTRLAIAGTVAAPVLVALDASRPRQLDVVQAAWDGHIHALLPDQPTVPGSPTLEVPGWPVLAPAPASHPPSGYSLVDDHKLDATPAVAYFDGPSRPPTLVERTQYTFVNGPGLTFAAFGFVDAFAADGSMRPGWPVILPSVAEYYGSAQEFVTEGTTSAAAADASGTGLLSDEVAIAPAFTPPVLLNGAGRIVGSYVSAAPGLGQLLDPATLRHPAALEHAPDVPTSFGSSGFAFGNLAGTLRLATPEVGGVSIAGSEEEQNAELPINEYESVYPATGGIQSPGFPQSRMGLDFLGSPIFASMTADGLGDVVEGGDSDALTAYSPIGTPARGFPKWTSGWDVFSPTAGDLFGSGRNDLVTVTREGYLFVWATAGRAGTSGQWPRWQHDDYNSGNARTSLGPMLTSAENKADAGVR